MLQSQLTEQVIKIFFKVYNELGYGFLEKVYERAIMFELQKANIVAYSQQKIEVYYHEIIVGEYIADIFVEDSVILEIKAREKLLPENEAQLLNYLKATPVEVGLLLNFGKTAEFKRKIFTNDKKRNIHY